VNPIGYGLKLNEKERWLWQQELVAEEVLDLENIKHYLKQLK